MCDMYVSVHKIICTLCMHVHLCVVLCCVCVYVCVCARAHMCVCHITVGSV